MNLLQLFTANPRLKEAYLSGATEAFEDEDDAKAHANHFNVSIKKVMRESIVLDAEAKTESVGKVAIVALNSKKLTAAEKKAREEEEARIKAEFEEGEKEEGSEEEGEKEKGSQEEGSQEEGKNKLPKVTVDDLLKVD